MLIFDVQAVALTWRYHLLHHKDTQHSRAAFRWRLEIEAPREYIVFILRAVPFCCLDTCRQHAINKEHWIGMALFALHTQQLTVLAFGWLSWSLHARAHAKCINIILRILSSLRLRHRHWHRMQIKTITKRWNRTTNNVIVYTRNFSFTLSLSLCLSMCLVVGTECLLPQQRRLCVCMKYVQRSFCGGYSGAVVEWALLVINNNRHTPSFQFLPVFFCLFISHAHYKLRWFKGKSFAIQLQPKMWNNKYADVSKSGQGQMGMRRGN